MGNEKKVPEVVIRRLPRYYRYLCELIARGQTRISSSELARMMRDLIIERFPQLAPYLVPKCEKYGKGKEFCNESKRRSCGKHPILTDIMEDYHNYKDLCNS